MDDRQSVTFVEASGAGAERALREAADALPLPPDGPGGAAELLRSAERDDLWLLVLRGPVPGFEPPDGARTWRFVTAGPKGPEAAG